MHLWKLTLNNFKNLRECEIELSGRMNCFIGDNGAGKTNVLDAIYYLSFSKSFFNPSDQLNVLHNESWFMIKGIYDRNGEQEQIVCSFQQGNKKVLKRNSKSYRRISDHIGLLPLVMVSPGDSVLISGGSEERRKFIDGVISQYDNAYLEDLLRYNRVLLQRNNLLKQLAGSSGADQEVIALYDAELCAAGTRIYEKRKQFIIRLVPVFQRYYTAISQDAEQVDLTYASDLHQTEYNQLLANSFRKDLLLQYTTSGIHKDDLQMSISGHSIRKSGSQGQQKTFLVSLKLAQFEFIREQSSIKPILLLDDIFDKLDRHRVKQIVSLVSEDHFGQIFITDTNREHLDAILQSVSSDHRLFRVNHGTIENLE